MKKLIITRGIPGSGKSTTLEKAKIKDFTISTDALRLLYESPIYLSNGRLSISKSVNGIIWPFLFDLMEKKMQSGATVVIDAVHPTVADFKEYIQLAKKYNYEIACLDFTDVPTEYSEWNNQGRAEYAIVPEHAIKKFEAQIEGSAPLPEHIKIIKVRADGEHLTELHNWLMPNILDLSSYKEVVHIGDIQGCLNPLLKALPNGIEDDKFYIFIGDFCDRGQENGEVVRYLIDNVIGKPNVATLIGNHEYHLFREINGEEPVSEEFIQFTKKQFNLHGIGKSELKKLVAGIQDVIFYKHGDHKVMACHGGLPNIPKNPWMIPSYQYEKGVGYYEEDVDTTFNSMAPEGWYQVHGHRNIQNHPIVLERSINLEGKVEFGGYLRMATLDKNGFTGHEYQNDIVRPWRERLRRKGEIIPAWMAREEEFESTKIPEDVLQALRDHSGVRERQTTKYPFISSMSFTKDIFYDKAWDEVVNKARGLFIDIGEGPTYREIVSRSYDKFFTVNENESMQIDTLLSRVQFPLTGRMKENGFLGPTGYIERNDELFISSKGSPEGDFAELFVKLYHQKFNKNQHEEMKRMEKDLECSFVFEVIDPVLDPHMVEYDEPKLVLLDVVRRSMTYEKLDYPQLLKVGEKFGIEVAKEMVTLKNADAFKGWYKKNSRDMRNEYEGLVWQDARGEMFKTKTPFYSFWKLMRGTKDAILRERQFLSTPLPQNEFKALNKRLDKLKNTESSQEIIHSYLGQDDITYQTIKDMTEALRAETNPDYTVLDAIKNSVRYKNTVSRQSMGPFLETRDLGFTTEEADKFKEWCFNQPNEILEQDIIAIRKIYKERPLLEQVIPEQKKNKGMEIG